MDLSCFSVACYLFIEISMSSIFNTIIGNKNAVINIFSNTAFTCMLLLLLLLSRFSHVWLPPGSPVPGILQARTLEWVAISFSNAWKWKVKVKSLSRVRPLATPWIAAYQAPPSMGFSKQEHRSGVPLPSLQPNTTNLTTRKSRQGKVENILTEKVKWQLSSIFKKLILA